MGCAGCLDDGIIMNTKLRFILERIKCEFFIYFKKIASQLDRSIRQELQLLSFPYCQSPFFPSNSFFLLSELINWNRMQDFLHPFL
jgi:hypothetical protein